MEKRLNVLFLCTGNACRSQMAEGWAKHLQSDLINAYSAGIETHGLNPHAVAVMAEAGIDISTHNSKLISDLAEINFDLVITVCGHADKNCPVFPADCPVIHVGFDDPPRLAAELAAAEASEEEQLECYRRIRDEIRDFIASFPDDLPID